MKAPSWFQSLGFGTLTGAFIHRIPIQAQYHSPPNTNLFPRNQQKPSQNPLSQNKLNNHDPDKIPIKDTAMILYGLPITLGTPPQSFPITLDLSWSTLFVPSQKCHTEFCNSHSLPRFSSSLSSSFIQGHQTLSIEYNSMHFSGKISNETLCIGNLQVKNQRFLEATDIDSHGWFHWYFDYVGVLGFQPSFDGAGGRGRDKAEAESPWQMLVQSGELDRNVFSIRLPGGPHEFFGSRGEGELVLGGVDEIYDEEEFLSLPLVHTVPGSWSVEAQSVTWGNGSVLHQEFNNCVATFSISTPFIGLPGAWADTLYNLIGAHEHDGFFMGFPCENRGLLPNLTFVLGGKEIILSSYEYSFEAITGEDDIGCLVGFDVSEPDSIVLGWPFMENFVSVFDQDLMEIRLAKLSHK